MSDLDSRLRAALRELAPDHPSTHGLAANALNYASRARRARRGGVAGATAAVLAVAVLAVGSWDRPDGADSATSLLNNADCTRQAASRATPSPDGEPMDSFGASWVCPDITASGASDAADGWHLPTRTLTARRAQTLILAGRDIQESCGSIRPGPPFTLTLEGTGGLLTTYRSQDLSCGGAYTLASYFEAMAADEVDARADRAPDDRLACRSLGWWWETRTGDPTPSPLVDGTFCLGPRFIRGGSFRPAQPMVARSYLPIRLSADVLAMLNADLRSAKSFFTGNGACRGEGAWHYSIMGLTAEGERHMLSTGCLDEFSIVGTRAGFIPSAETTAMLRALVPPA